MRQYKELIKTVLEKGNNKSDRTNTGTRSIFGYQTRFDLTKGFPLVTTKYTNFEAIKDELLWFLRGDTNINTLNSGIWNQWADWEGNLGPIYGKQWRDWNGIDQIKNTIKLIKTNPDSRRIIVSAWNVSCLPSEQLSPQANVDEGRMALAPCHTLFQFYCNGNKLSMQLYQRSGDVMLGVPFNIASYALLLEMVAHVTGKIAHELVYTLGDAHIYSNHKEAAYKVLMRSEKPSPTIELNPFVRDIDEFVHDDIKLIGYKYHPKIKLDVAV